VAQTTLTLVLAAGACGETSSGEGVDGAAGADSAPTADSAAGGSEAYVLYNQTGSVTTYLIDLDGRVVHQWDCDSRVAYSAYLLENGNLLRPGEVPNSAINGGGAGGKVQEIDWDGNVLWEFVYNSDSVRPHHDIEPLPNGNVLMIAWEVKSAEEAVAAGSSQSRGMWPDHIIEVEPTYPTGGNIVWEWHAWDHLVQDVDPDKPNYGVVADNPGKIDINAAEISGPPGMGDWLHLNSIDYNAELDQIILSSHFMSELYVIDHDTTTEQAAGPAGDILYRWGNPEIYDAGTAADRTFFVVHHASWIDPGLPGAGHIMAFNNGDRPGTSDDYSSVEEIDPPVDQDGHYTLSDGTFGPTGAAWTYEDPPDFYANHISSAHRLPNGDTFVCEGTSGHFFEVTPAGDVVWEYTAAGEVARAYRYESDYPGLAALHD